MKKIYSILTAFAMAMLVSCSSGVAPKEITPTSTEFTSGELGRYIEVVDQPSELTFSETEGSIPAQYIRLKVTLRLIKEGIKDVDARDINFTGLLSVAIINLVDENGSNIQDLSVKNEDLMKLKKLLTGSVGDTEEIIFEGDYHNHDDAPKWFKQASKFTPYLTGDITTEGSSSDEDETESKELTETSEENSDSNFSLSSSGSEDWDDLLNSYEQYVDKCIPYMKKAAKGDISALSEYPALMEKAQEFGEKMENAQGEMSASQWARYMKITNKMTQAAANMQ